MQVQIWVMTMKLVNVRSLIAQYKNVLYFIERMHLNQESAKGFKNMEQLHVGGEKEATFSWFSRIEGKGKGIPGEVMGGKYKMIYHIWGSPLLMLQFTPLGGSLMTIIVIHDSHSSLFASMA